MLTKIIDNVVEAPEAPCFPLVDSSQGNVPTTPSLVSARNICRRQDLLGKEFSLYFYQAVHAKENIINDVKYRVICFKKMSLIHIFHTVVAL